MSIHEFASRIDQKNLARLHDNERGSDLREIGERIKSYRPQGINFTGEQGVELSQMHPRSHEPYESHITPFINYFGVDVAIGYHGDRFNLIVRSDDGGTSEYATVFDTVELHKEMTNLTAEEKEKAQEEVVDIFQAFARCFGVSTD